jgi:hypothetical protein
MADRDWQSRSAIQGGVSIHPAGRLLFHQNPWKLIVKTYGNK